MLENINLGIEFTGHNIDPVVPVPEYVTAQTSDLTSIIITTLVLLGIICLFLIGISKAPLFSTNTQGLHLRTSSKSKQNSKPTISAIFAVILALMLICSCYFSTKAFAGNNDANIDVTPDKIQVVVDGDTGTIQEAVFNFENNSDNFYLFDKTTSMSLTPEAAAITQAADWDLQLTALETDLFNGAPDGSDYTVPGDVVTLMPHTSAQAVLKFNKCDFETAKKLVGIQVFTLTMIPDQHVVDIPTAPDNIVYNGQSQTAIPDTEAYTVKNGSGTNADSYNAIVTLNSDYKWPDKSTTPQTISWVIAPLPVALSWETPTLTYNGEAQHPIATVTNFKVSDDVAPETYSYPEGYDGISAKEQKVYVATLGGTSASNYTLEGATGNEKTYAIAKKALKITADDKEKIEGAEEDPELTATFDGLVHEESFVKETDYTISRQTAAEEHVGDKFDITVAVSQGSQVAKNYSITTVKGKLTIIPKNPVITPDAISKIYGTSVDPTLTATVENIEEGFPLVIDTDFTLTREEGENAGEYKITVTLNETEHVAHYETIALKEGTFTIDKRAAVFEWTNESFIYNKEAQTPKATITNPVGSDEVSADTYAGIGECDITSAGEQNCKVSGLKGTSAENYSLDDDSNAKTYTIKKADVTWDVTVSSDFWGTQPRNFKDVKLTSTHVMTFGPDESDIAEIKYSWYYANNPEGDDPSIIEGATEDKFTIEKDSYVGIRYYFLVLKTIIKPENTNFNNGSTSNSVPEDTEFVKFVYTKMNFNDQISNDTTTLYTKYATDELYAGETSTETAEIPTAAKPDFVFDGWFTGASDGSRVVDFEKQIVPETIDGYVKDGKWANTVAKTIYAHFYQAQYMTFTNQAEGENTISFNFAANSWSNLPSLILRVSTDAETWKLIQTDVPGSFEIATLSALNDKVYVAGYNPNGFSSDTRIGTFSSTGKFSVSGNYMALIDYTRSDITAIPNDYCFQQLFKDCSNLTSVPKLDFTFDKENQSHCLNQMFENCSLINYLEVTFKQWPENGFKDWVKGIATRGTFICPDELEWKTSQDPWSPGIYSATWDFCPLNFHNSLGEGRYYFDSTTHTLHFYVEGEETHSNFGVLPLDYSSFGNPLFSTDIRDYTTAITYTPSFKNWTINLRSVMNWFYMFLYINKIDVQGWNTSNIVAVDRCFGIISKCKEINVSGWDLTKCEFCTYMFFGDEVLENIFTDLNIDLSHIGTEKSKSMFLNCYKLPNYSSSETDSAKAKNRLYGGYFSHEYQGMMHIDDAGKATFYTLSDNVSFDDYYLVDTDRDAPPDWPSEKITSIEVASNYFSEKWMPNVSSVAYWFRNSKITKYNSNNFIPTDTIDNAKYFLSGCHNLQSVTNRNPWKANLDATCFVSECENLETFEGLMTFYSAKSLNQMFWGCSKLNNIYWPQHTGWPDFENLESAYLMFAGCSSLETLYIGDMFVPATYSRCKLTNCSAMFSGCTALKNLYCNNGEDNWYEFLEGKNTSNMFDGCTSLPHYSDSSPKDAQWAKADNGTEGYFTIKP